MAGNKNQASEDNTSDAIAEKDATIEALTATVKEKDEALETANTTIADLETENTQLKEAVAKGTENTPSTKRPSYNGNEFLVDKFRFKGVKYTAEEAVNNSSLMKEILESAFVGIKRTK